MSRIAHVLNNKWRSSDIQIEEDVNFNSLFLSDKVLHGLKSSGFVRPSPIQYEAIPLGRLGLDLIVQAKSGTGKTCVFAVIALERLLLESKATQALVLAPTREVAVQICQVVRGLGVGFKGLQCHTFIGGLPVAEDKIKLKKCHIAVGTPGRIKQLIKEDVLKTNSIRLFVLDEADKLLEEGFQETINWIYSSLPIRKQMLALSATYPEKLAELLELYMRKPTFVRLNVDCPSLLGVAQFYSSTPHSPMQHICFQSKVAVLLKILKNVSFSQCLVFSNYQTRAESLCDVLKKSGWPAEFISGGQEQCQRLRAIDSLKQFKCRVLVSTDVTSRGIDAENVNLVVNMDVPWELETYLHRIGRAGRFGTRGLSITLLSGEEDTTFFHKIRESGNLQVSVLPDPMPPCLWTYANQLGENCQSTKTDDQISSESSQEVEINNDQEQNTQLSQTKASNVTSENRLNLQCSQISNHEGENVETSTTKDHSEEIIHKESPSLELSTLTSDTSFGTDMQESNSDKGNNIYENLSCYFKENFGALCTLPERETMSADLSASFEFLKMNEQEPVAYNSSQPVFSYDELMNDFDRSLHENSGEDQMDELVEDLSEEMQLLLNLNSFLASSHEEYRLKLEDGFGRCNEDKKSEQSEQTELPMSTGNCVDSQNFEADILCEESGSTISNAAVNVSSDSVPPEDVQSVEEPSKHPPSFCNQAVRNASNISFRSDLAEDLANGNVIVEPSEENAKRPNVVRRIKESELRIVGAKVNSSDVKNEEVVTSTRTTKSSESSEEYIETNTRFGKSLDVPHPVNFTVSEDTQTKVWRENQTRNSSRKHKMEWKKDSSDGESSFSNLSKNVSGFEGRPVHSVHRRNKKCTCNYERTLRKWWKPNTRMAVVYLEYQNFISDLVHTYRRESKNFTI